MMRNLLLAAALLVAVGAAFGSTAAGARRQGPMVGGYKPVAANDAQVTAAARFAVAAQGKKENHTIRLLSVETAERQTVQGASYRLCLKVETEDTDNNVDVTEHVKVVVYQNLQRAYTLRSWVVEDCGGDDD